MILFTAFVIAAAVVFCFALAASSSPVYGFNAKAELAARRENGESGGGLLSRPAKLSPMVANSRPGASAEELPVLSAAGMQ